MLFDVRQAAERAAVCERIIRAWVADGTLPCFRLGRKGSRGKIVIAAEDLDGALAAFKVGKAAPPLPAEGPRPKPVFKHVRA